MVDAATPQLLHFNIITSTVKHQSLHSVTPQLGAKLALAGVRMVDAPVSGGPRGARVLSALCCLLAVVCCLFSAYALSSMLWSLGADRRADRAAIPLPPLSPSATLLR
jgi:hypothetical protein